MEGGGNQHGTTSLNTVDGWLGSQSYTIPPELRKALTVTAHSQALHLKLVVHTFAEAGRRVRASARGRLRLATDAFEAHADFACLYSATILEARQLSTWNQEKEDAILKSYFQK